jgi:hypothetical protein
MKVSYRKFISFGALVAMAGFMLSGPVGFIVVRLVKPQPEWSSPGTFVQHYHIVQDFPYYFGFLLIGGMVMLASGHYLDYGGNNQKTKFCLLTAFAVSVVFCALVAFNYIAQTTFVRHLALNYHEGHDSAITMFSMTNPLSIAWAVEMWAYGFLGLANLLTTGYYKGKTHSFASF